jgi:3,4-dihydroxy 2-butanone 4-phosphate synthase / GTP cyclohydrolase II
MMTFLDKESDAEVPLDSIEAAIEQIRAGKIIMVVDDSDRENEGDMICASECVTPEIITFMATNARGLICISLSEQRCAELALPLMVKENTSHHHTAFTVSVDLLGQGCTTGISSHDRAKTVRALVDPGTNTSDLATPGHVFPIMAKSGGVLKRPGHTEAASDFASLAGFQASGVLVEVLNEDGSMARLPDLRRIADKHNFRLVSIKDLIQYLHSKRGGNDVNGRV